MNRILADDLVRFPGPCLGAGRKIDLMPEVISETENELLQSLALAGGDDYDTIEGELFDALGIGLSGPLKDFVKGVGQAVFNVGRGGRNLVRAVFQKPPLPTYNLKNGQLNTALDNKTTVSLSQNGITVGGELIAPASEVQTAYDQGYTDAGGGSAGAGTAGPTVTVPGVGAVPVIPIAIAGGAGLILALLIRR